MQKRSTSQKVLRLYNLSYQLILQPTAPGHILQIFLRVTIQNQIRIAQRVIVDEIVQLRPLRHSHVQRILDPGAVDGNHSLIPEQQFHATGVHVTRCYYERGIIG